MPTRYSACDYRPPPSWCSTWQSFYDSLEPNVADILKPCGFYERFDIDIPDTAEGRKLGIEERAAIEHVATALTIAADAAHRTPPGVVAAWLRRISESPELFRSPQLPPEVYYQIVSHYRRESERPGTHLQDVWGRRRVRFEAKARRATNPRIARAACLAMESFWRPRGRPHNVANKLLAESLGLAFRSFGGRIVRRRSPIDLEGGGHIYVDDGPFYRFLERVTGPLQEYLKSHRLQPVTIETIERIAARQFV
jgi:hypothetical protein